MSVIMDVSSLGLSRDVKTLRFSVTILTFLYYAFTSFMAYRNNYTEQCLKVSLSEAQGGLRAAWICVPESVSSLGLGYTEHTKEKRLFSNSLRTSSSHSYVRFMLFILRTESIETSHRKRKKFIFIPTYIFYGLLCTSHFYGLQGGYKHS